MGKVPVGRTSGANGSTWLNRRAGALITEHLLTLGCARPVFLGLPNAASSVDGREAAEPREEDDGNRGVSPRISFHA